ncbi:hypothetical protein BDZ97DRAFT_1659533 [Flammula alnicola]|nr:hypothetical protein BDZ97DRAFT_1659533 [Flammula alnicola]
MLEPQGFYDALEAYGLPSTISDLDRSSQENVPYCVKTAYGFTEPFVVNGVTKQGGSLSPLKCTLTTSLAKHWISDLIRDQAGHITVMSHNARLAQPHTPADHLSQPICMVEAMDDTLLMTSSMPTMLHAARHADRFQATYGWETEWRKSMFYAYRTPEFPAPTPVNQTVDIPSVNFENPSSMETLLHPVPVTTQNTVFLRVPINRPDLHFLHLQDLVSNFTFPLLSRPLPVTALRRILSQCLVSKIRPLLNFQTVSSKHAATLDQQIAHKVHSYLGMPFHFRTSILTASIDDWGLGFSSISRINDSLSVAGLQRDLNHHILSFRNMAQISLADWTCSHNKCRSPLTLPNQSRSFSRLHRYLPAAWIHAFTILQQTDTSLLSTDLSYILLGSVSLQHLNNLLPTDHRLPTRLVSNLRRYGFSFLSQLGQWNLDPTSFLPLTFCPFHFTFSPAQALITRDWPTVSLWLSSLPSSLSSLSYPDITLLLPRPLRQYLAEHVVLALSQFSSAFPHQAPRHLFSSDASHVNRGNSSTVIFAVIANGNAFSASLNTFGPRATILQGEAYGIVATSLLAREHQARRLYASTTVYTDHLNSVRLINNANASTSTSLTSHPARSLYRWILDIRSSTSPSNAPVPAATPPSLEHIPVPVPTFTMDPFTPYSPSNGFIECNIMTHIDQALSRNVSTAPSCIVSRLLYDANSPPQYPYSRALSSYSATIQLYSRSNQLDSAYTLSTRLGTLHQPWCRFNCQCFETSHHLFTACPRFAEFRNTATQALRAAVSTTFETFQLDPANLPEVMTIIANLFADSSCWPTARSFYYLGVIPPIQLPTGDILQHLTEVQRHRLHQRLTDDCHVTAIRLAARIWGIVRRTFSPFSTSSRPTKSISLPHHLSHIVSSSHRLTIAYI